MHVFPGSLLACILFHDISECFGKFTYLFFLHLVIFCCLKILPFFPNYVLNLSFSFRFGTVKVEELSELEEEVSEVSEEVL